MNNFFGSIYQWFLTLFGQDLSYFLWGYDPMTGGYTNPNIYNHVGMVTFAISLLLAFLFYYVIDHPRWCRWWSWLLSLLIDCAMGLSVGFAMVYSKYANGLIPKDLMCKMDADGSVVAYLIAESNCWGFGMANMLVSAIFFILLSFILKWASNNSKYVPF